MLITITCFSVGSYGLIQMSFNTSLEREIDMIYQENDVLYTTLQPELMRSFINYYPANFSSKDKVKLLQESIETLTIRTLSSNMMFSLRTIDGNLIYQNGNFNADYNFKGEIGINECGYRIIKNKNNYYLHALRKLETDNINIYIENAREISSVFKNRNKQFQSYLYCITFLITGGAIMIYFITRWLIKPIKQLSIATKQITKGDLVEPLIVQSNDEIGQLTKDFNTMSNQLQVTISELKESIENREIFVGNFAHELKTPLTSIIGYGDMLRSKRLSEEEIINYANLIVQEGKRLEGLSMKLLDLIVLKKEDFIFQKIDAFDFLNQIKKTVAIIMKTAQIDFNFEAQHAIIEIEPDLMKTVCLNLLDNARKAIRENRKIELIGRISQNDYQIIVKDNGCGIDEKELTKVKEAFYMVDKSRSRSAGGAGLGLAICDQIIQLHRGKFDIKSSLHQGTIVTISLNVRGKSDEAS